ncbi:putative pathogenicity factor [Diplodia corticola]|uniref:Putative pathogenicity factor n=1 Tax=Diplodia corticola TaxID=236234 RepID=A0A1J9SAL2_9PEZI|nr:putative pathogenicity factor [Diplodia corticola]OJD37535.1 putative pathogenicity factor [Diplodia corticola]
MDVMRLENILNAVDDREGKPLLLDVYGRRSDLAAQAARQDAAETLLQLGLSLDTPMKTWSPAQRARACRPLPPNDSIMPSPPHRITDLSAVTAESGDSSSEFTLSPSTAVDDAPPSSVTNTTDHDDDEPDLFLPPTDDDDDNDHDHETAGDPTNREFNCWAVPHSRCMTGQYTLPLSRKMVSDYFGRNKAGTRRVQPRRWIRACRKHYQRQSYQDSWRWHKGRVVIRQLQLIAAQQQPPLTFRVALKSSEEKRLERYKGGLVDAGRLFDRHREEVTRLDEEKPDQAPLAVLQDIKEFVRQRGGEAACLGAADCEELVGRAIDWVKGKKCLRLPLFEMMPLFADEEGAEKEKKTKKKKTKATPAAGKKRKAGSAGAGSAAKRVMA